MFLLLRFLATVYNRPIPRYNVGLYSAYLLPIRFLSVFIFLLVMGFFSTTVTKARYRDSDKK